MRCLMLVVLQALALGDCAGQAVPIEFRTSKGVTLRGTVTGSILNAKFEVSNGRLTCAGIYPRYEAKIVTVTLRCTDGRRGIALVTRRGLLDGSGTVRFSDHSEGSFAFGDGAARF